MAWEAKPLERWRVPPIVEVDGPGPTAARAAAERAVERGAGLLLSWGSAGALGSAAPGDIVLADAVVGDSIDGPEQRWACAPGRVNQLARCVADVAAVHRGLLYSAREAVTQPAEKESLGRRFGAVAVDMESAAVAQVAARAGLEFAALRVIVDAADQVVPAAAIAALDGPRTRPLRVAAGLLESPGQLPGLLRLAAAARRTRRALALCARRIEADFADPGR